MYTDFYNLKYYFYSMFGNWLKMKELHLECGNYLACLAQHLLPQTCVLNVSLGSYT